MALGRGETTSPEENIAKLLSKGEKNWTKQDKKDFELDMLLVGPEKANEITLWLDETPSLHLKK
jgi:hypothetical protein